ncbi:MAG: DUF2330 domain-containing protein [Chitinophagaceae bacterium]|nr:DUF2330 domain-containing protein [Chitinophagaceae bacterium]
MKKKTIAAFLVLVFASHDVWAFCGFYVSKADGTLTNKTSQVILVRDGDRTVITMSNDFKGDVTDFAMVVPVPTVLKKSDIKVVEADLFQRLNDYSKPRLVEYYDQNPCQQMEYSKMDKASASEVIVQGYGLRNKANRDEEEYKVKVEATYTVGEYDIVILSAEESGGLYKWLTANKYKIPKGAAEVLEPYIKSNMKFFVVKVNVEEQENLGFEQLRPIQIKFNSPKFMLPIRLGMANADGDQDMIVYALTRNGRVESTNYRTTQMPTGKNIPLFVNTNFGNFYANTFQHQWLQQNQSILFLEYAWDVSPSNYMKCDPCVSEPPNYDDLLKAGVWWLGKDAYNDYVNQYETKSQNVFFTRLHVRYNRKAFAQDLVFQETPNRENYQARYIITHPATGDLNCEAGKKYLKELKERRKKEMDMLAALTGKGYDDWDVVMDTDEAANVAAASYATVSREVKAEAPKKEAGKDIFMASLALLSMVTMIGVTRRRKEK